MTLKTRNFACKCTREENEKKRQGAEVRSEERLSYGQSEASEDHLGAILRK
jgi:hypothetical protein